MLGLIWAGRIAPGVTAALAGVDPEVAADLRVGELGEPLGRLDPQAVDEELLRELAVGFELVDPLGDLRRRP